MNTSLRKMIKAVLKALGIKIEKEKVHVLHIGKTGGSAIKETLKPHRDTGSFRIFLEEHEITLQDIPEGEKVVFIVRDPIKRFISGFYSRKRKGQPRYNVPWSEAEEIAFSHFSTPNELASALSADDKTQREIAENAMRGIMHVNSSLWDWFGSEKYFQSRLPDILFVGFQERLGADFEVLKKILKLPASAVLPADNSLSHKNPDHLDKHLDEAAKDNLMKWYKKDYDFFALCKKIAEQIQQSCGA